MPNVVTYYRVSTEEQALKDLSIAAQRKIVMNYITDHGDHTFLKEFVDEGESGYAPAEKRPGFMSMMDYCRRGKVDLVLVYKFCRFSRFQEESVGYKAIIRRMGGRVRSVSEPTDPDTAAGFLYEGMIEVINQFYSMNLATETLRGMKENASRGFVNGGRTPYGYRISKIQGNNGEEHGRLIPGPDNEVRVVREIFELAVRQGMGCRQITNALNRRGEPGPNGKHWTVATVGFMLNNRVYVGDTVWFKTRKRGRDQRQRNEADRQVVVENTHEALVDRALFEERAQHARARPFREPASPASPTEYLLTRLLRCGCCGSTFSVRRQNYKGAKGDRRVRTAYYCNGYASKGKEVCPSLPIPVEWADGVVIDVLRAHLCDPDTLATLDQAAEARIRALCEQYGTDGRTLRKQLAALDERITRYIEAIGAGVDIKVCQAEIEKARARKAALEAQAEAIQHEDYITAALERNRAQVSRFAEALRGDFTRLPMPIQRRVLLYFIRDLVVKDRRELVIETIVPFDNAGLDQLLDQIETVEKPGVGETAAADQDPSFSERSGHGRDDQEWLPVGLLTDTRDDTVDDELIAWPTVLLLEEYRSLGPHRPHPAPEVMQPARQGAQEGAEGAQEPNRWTEPRARIQALLAKANGWARWLAANPRNLGADLARREGISRARVSQILTLCKLAPQIMGDLTRKDDLGPVPNERQLRELARIADPQAQVSRYREMGGMRPRVMESTAADPQAGAGADPKAHPLAQATRPKGLQHAFAEARRLQAILDAEPGLSVAELGRREGITGSRVSQILGLLQLPAAMVATLDVVPQEAPKVGTKQVRVMVGMM